MARGSGAGGAGGGPAPAVPDGAAPGSTTGRDRSTGRGPAPAVPDGPFRAVLTTTGRSTGAEHSVELLAVARAGRIYFSRHRPDSDWFKNAARSPQVRVEFGGASHRGTARVVDDARLAAEVSALKYPGQARASEKRVAVEVTLGGPW